MYASSTFVLTAIVALARFAAATPPACLIAAIGAQSNPADLKSLCGTLESQVAGNITEKCEGNNLSSAQSAFSSTCLASESVTISFTSSSSSSKTGSASATTTSPGSKATATGSSGSTSGSASASKTSGSGTSTVTGTGASASSTGNAGSVISPQSGFILLAAGLAGQYFL